MQVFLIPKERKSNILHNRLLLLAQPIVAYLLDVVTVTKENIVPALVETGYWTQEQIDKGGA